MGTKKKIKSHYPWCTIKLTSTNIKIICIIIIIIIIKKKNKKHQGYLGKRFYV